jgi:hypothetical protein
MIIHDLHIPGVSVPELESDPPSPAGRDRPLGSAGTAKAMKAHRRQSSQVVKAFCLIEQPKPSPGQGFVEAGKAALPLPRKALT